MTVSELFDLQRMSLEDYILEQERKDWSAVIQAIRQKCFEANPNGFDCGSPCRCPCGRMTVHLVDVLLSLPKGSLLDLWSGSLSIGKNEPAEERCF
jgi:hypothetical protein